MFQWLWGRRFTVGYRLQRVKHALSYTYNTYTLMSVEIETVERWILITVISGRCRPCAIVNFGVQSGQVMSLAASPKQSLFTFVKLLILRRRLTIIHLTEALQWKKYVQVRVVTACGCSHWRKMLSLLAGIYQVYVANSHVLNPFLHLEESDFVLAASH